MKTAMDAAGRLVVPKPIRERAGLQPGQPLEVVYRDGRIEIEAAPREIRIVERDGIRVAEPVGPYETLSEDTARKTREQIRADRRRR